MPDTFHLKAHGAPCGKDCPLRDLPACRRTCEPWQTYEAQRMEKAAKKSSYGADGTIGRARRAVHNIKYKKKMSEGRL